jgi:hypothetical protein
MPEDGAMLRTLGHTVTCAARYQLKLDEMRGDSMIKRLMIFIAVLALAAATATGGVAFAHSGPSHAVRHATTTQTTEAEDENDQGEAAEGEDEGDQGEAKGEDEQ